ncbi:hypothetical protein CPB84DRAFT_1763853 [Gymnopilus junonius]|uniref:Uncharacterized protein n=1 Tax=Gymnopilus junonius TaxID=109634 RepID=A0A9P5NVD4_GYMJU|nr:hypothetical protein CPB84DRAFT_1763853 [Gymnopilus junonius]
MNSSDSNSILQFAASVGLGRGLVEIVALATLIGSSTAGDLVLGNKGAAGLVWGSISAFGCSSVIKACASAASPGWLKQMLGLRTAQSDKTLGMDLLLAPKSRVAGRIRSMLDDPLGVSCDSDPKKWSRAGPEHRIYHDIYAFDNDTSIMLSEINPTFRNSPLAIHTHYPYPSYHAHSFRFQLIVLLLSLLKISEIYTLLRLQHGGTLFGLLAGAPFVFSLFSGLCLEIADILASRRPVEVDGHLDILAASSLLTTKRVGGPRKNPRSGPWWKFFWIMTGTLQVLFLVKSYFLLVQQSASFVLIWTGFQLFWAVLRILIFKSDITDASQSHIMDGRPMQESKLESLPLVMKLRVANLVLALGSYQAHVHPRKLDAYLDDSFSTSQIARLLAPGNISEVYTVPRSTQDVLQAPFYAGATSAITEKAKFASTGRTTIVNILAVIGDTALSSAAWVLGNPKYDYSPMELYDCCVVVFEVLIPSSIQEKHAYEPKRRIVAVPSARVYSARSAVDVATSRAQQDTLEPLFIPRGAGAQDSAEEKEWLYWIPCDTGEWLQIRSPSSGSKAGSVLGQQTVEVLGDDAVSRVLGAGNLNISLKDAKEVTEIVAISRRAVDGLLSFFH